MQTLIMMAILATPVVALADSDSITVKGSNRVTIVTESGGKKTTTTVKNGKQTTTTCQGSKCKTEVKDAK